MTPENIAMLQKTLGIEPTGVMDPKTMAAFKEAYDASRTDAGLKAHAARESAADLERQGEMVPPEGGIPGMLGAMKPEDRARLLQKLSGAKL